MEELDKIIDDTYRWSRHRGFRGYNKHDALNSPLLKALLGWGRWPRIVAIQAIMRFPVNIRALLLTRRTQNPKGLGLFISGLVDCYRATSDEHYLKEAEAIVPLLTDLKSQGDWQGDCWGYPYPWQDLNFFAAENLPNAVVTCFVCEGLLDLYEINSDDTLLKTVGRAIRFLTGDLPVLYETETELCFSYIPDTRNTARVMDVSILIAALISRYAALSNDMAHAGTARRLVHYVVVRITQEGAWFYTDPPEDSPITHDNYHTGFILDALNRYMHYSGNTDYQAHYDRGLTFYKEKLFNSDSSPRWMDSKDYPHDIHGAAQGLITFSRHIDANRSFLQALFGWTITNLYSGKGKFYYQKTRWFTKRITLMRWCNAWAFRALAAYRLARASQEK